MPWVIVRHGTGILRFEYFGTTTARAVAKSPRFAGTRELWIGSLPPAPACEALFQTLNFARLRRLHVRRAADKPAIKAKRPAAEARSFDAGPDASYLGRAIGECVLRDLAELEIVSCALGDEGAIALASSKHLSIVESLKLHGAAIGDRGAEALAAGPWGETLRSLDLSHNPMGVGAMHALGQMRRLEILTFAGRWIGDDEAEAIASWRMPRLRYLYLGQSRIGPRGARALARASRAFPALRMLALDDTTIGPAGAAAFAESMWLTPGRSGFYWTDKGRADLAETERVVAHLRGR